MTTQEIKEIAAGLRDNETRTLAVAKLAGGAWVTITARANTDWSGNRDGAAITMAIVTAAPRAAGWIDGLPVPTLADARKWVGNGGPTALAKILGTAAEYGAIVMK